MGVPCVGFSKRLEAIERVEDACGGRKLCEFCGEAVGPVASAPLWVVGSPGVVEEIEVDSLLEGGQVEGEVER